MANELVKLVKKQFRSALGVIELAVSRARAEEVATAALTWLAGNEELLPVFMGSTGLSADDLRQAALAPEFLGAVLDFILMDDAWIVRFCDQAQLPYDLPQQARMMLLGGEQVHWT